MPIDKKFFKPGMFVSFPNNQGPYIPKYVSVITKVSETGICVIDLVFKKDVYVPFPDFTGQDGRLNVSIETIFSAIAVLKTEKERLEEIYNGKNDISNDFMYSRILLTTALYKLFSYFQSSGCETHSLSTEQLEVLKAIFVSAYRPW